MDKRKCLLAVDDDECLLDLYASIFSSRYRVLAASSAKTARQLLANHTIDIILLDLAMPDIYGLNLLSEVKTAFPHVPAIIVSGSCTLETANRAYRMGAAYCVNKPFESQTLVGMVDRLVGKDEMSC